MWRGVILGWIGSIALVALAACSRGWFEERAPWRHEAEVECLKSGAVKEGPAITAMRPIEGPGMCGADFPLKVSALGEASPLGFADDPRPPGSIPSYAASPPFPPAAPYSPAPRYAPVTNEPLAKEPGAPVAISPPGLEPYEEPQDMTGPSSGPYQAPLPDRPAAGGVSVYSAPAGRSAVPLGPPRGPINTAGPAALSPEATLACPVVSVLDNWVTSGVQPAALRWLGEPVVEIRQISAYSCRPMNGQRGAPISEHAFGNALDVAAFILADGRRITVRDGWHGAPEESAFLHDVQGAACRMFSTVLAPGANAFHYDHIHMDLARHASGRSICNPAPIPGELVAARRGGPAITGSLGRTGRPGVAANGFDRDRERSVSFDGSLPNALPGAD